MNRLTLGGVLAGVRVVLLQPALGAGALLILPVLAAAQQQEEPHHLDPFVVREAPLASLTAPKVEEARTAIRRRPGAVDLVSSEAFLRLRAVTTKDILDYVPGVFAQPKFGEDTRLSIRGSGLSRNFHLRGVTLLQDGVIPINTSDGSGDFQEIDPLALRYAEVYKGANALEYGAATLGGAVNFVMPTGRDFPRFLGRLEYGSFNTRRIQVASGGADGAWDYFITPTWLLSDGYREHSAQDSIRLNTNLGYRLAARAETRFYFSYSHIDQEIPGSVSKRQALTDPEAAVPINVINHWKRDIESFRLANKTTFVSGDTEFSFGAFAFDRQLDHPIFQVLDNHHVDYGGFARLARQGALFGRANKAILGGSFHAGETDARRFLNHGGNKGDLTWHMEERALNFSVYGENQFYVTPELVLALGAQAVYAKRKTSDRLPVNGDDSADKSYTNINPKIGLLWDAGASWQIFGNVSRSSEPPTFSELNPTAQTGFADLDAQTAITAEIGARGQRDAFAWSVSLYRAWLRDELQLFDAGGGATFALNADKTLHQGVELGFEIPVLKNILSQGEEADELRLRTSYTFSDFRFREHPVFGNNKLPGAPRHYLRAELLYRHPSGLYMGPNIEWAPQAYFVDNANRLETDAYALLGFRAGYEFSFGSLFFDLRNILDKTYISNVSVAPVATPDAALFNPGEGLAAYMGVQIRL